MKRLLEVNLAAKSTVLNIVMQSYGKPMSCAGSMTFVLDIIGRLDIFLPSVAVIYITSLRKCIRSRKYQMGQVAHSHIIKLGFVSELLVSNILLDMYAKAGLVDCSAKVFDEMAHGDQFSWCGLISGHVRHGFDLEAYGLFRRMIEMGHKPKHFVLSSVLKACSASGILELGVLVHSFALKSGLDFDRFVEVGLVSMYAKCGALDDAVKVFYEIPIKNSVSWNTIISGCIQNRHLMKAVEMCREMCQAGFIMDLVTLRIVMSAGSALQGLDFCRSIHVYSIKVGLDIDCFIVAELVKLLVRLGNVPYMTQLFNIVKRPDASLYTLLISGYHANGFRAEAVNLAKELLCLGMELKEGSVISNALISMCIRNGELEEAYEIFLEMPERDAISWTAIMAGLANEYRFKEALETFQAFRKTEMQVDQHSATVAISVCTSLRDIDKGRQIHALIEYQSGLIPDQFSLSIILGACADMKNYEDGFRGKSNVLREMLMAGYISYTGSNEAINVFGLLQRSCFHGNPVAFARVLKDRAVEDTHVLPRGDNATSDSNVFRIQEDEDEDKMCFLGCSKEEKEQVQTFMTMALISMLLHFLFDDERNSRELHQVIRRWADTVRGGEAKENVYIQKMEREKIEKQKRKAEKERAEKEMAQKEK
ncbi:hypothetical protein HPP92_009659 [Vanilla planifolia]|uniref:Pentatricopeptide repeat-containing protein n=1 Tax=Vanilla planifolia TaxID=51239 RepID=A0A835RAP1_VANPL|nr:hypothetical protein HPP92_009659 [Vanilla planifolia]